MKDFGDDATNLHPIARLGAIAYDKRELAAGLTYFLLCTEVTSIMVPYRSWLAWIGVATARHRQGGHPGHDIIHPARRTLR